MKSKAVNGFTSTQVDRALRGLDAIPIYRIRAELLDLDNVTLYELAGLQQAGEVNYNVERPMQGGAALEFLETLRTVQPSTASGYLNSFANVITAQTRLFHLRLGETSGNFSDYTGNGRTFTTHGGITYSVGALIAGDLANNGITLNGSTGYADIADAAWMDVTRITIPAWIRTTTDGVRLISRDNTVSNRAWNVAITGGGLVKFRIFIGAVQKEAVSSVAVTDGNIHHIVCTYDGAYMSIYVDGMRVGRTAQTGDIDNVAQSIAIGAVSGGGSYFNGSIDEIGIVGRALSPKEIRDEYQAGSNQTTELLLDRDRGDRVKIWYGVGMLSAGTDGTTWAEWPQIVALLTTPRPEYTPTGIVYSVSCQDQCRILADDTFASRWTIGAAVNYISGTNGVLDIAISAGFSTSGWAVTATSSVTPAAVDFEIGTSKLDAINYLLRAINYKPIRFSGDGSAIIEAAVLDKDKAVADTFAADSQSIIGARSIPVEIAARAVANQVVVANGNPDVSVIQVTATNSKVGSASSTAYLPPNVIAFQVDAPDSTKAGEIANQTLNDETARFAEKVLLDLLPYPIFEDRDRETLSIPQARITGDYVVSEWRLPLNPTEMMAVTLYSVVDVTT